MIDREAIQTVGVFRALQLGDMLCSVPAFRALRAALPEAHITLIGLPWAKSFVKRFSDYFDDFIHFPGAEGLPEQPYDRAMSEQFEKKIRDKSFDLLMQMQGNGTIVNRLLMNWGAKRLAGFQNQQSKMDSPLFLEYPESKHEVQRHLALMSHLGFTALGEHLEFPLNQRDMDDFNRIGLRPEKYIIVHPGSRGSLRQWPLEHFARCADYCHSKGYYIVITGTKDETHIADALAKHMSANTFNLTGKTSLGAVAHLIKNAWLLISNCTGVSHIASATETRSLIISMDGEPHRWAPLNKKLHTTIDWVRFPYFEEAYSKLKDILQANEEIAA